MIILLQESQRLLMPPKAGEGRLCSKELTIPRKGLPLPWAPGRSSLSPWNVLSDRTISVTWGIGHTNSLSITYPGGCGPCGIGSSSTLNTKVLSEYQVSESFPHWQIPCVLSHVIARRSQPCPQFHGTGQQEVLCVGVSRSLPPGHSSVG